MCIEDFTFQKNRIYFPINHARVVFNISNYYQSFSSINSGQPEMQNEFLFFVKKLKIAPIALILLQHIFTV